MKWWMPWRLSRLEMWLAAIWLLFCGLAAIDLVHGETVATWEGPVTVPGVVVPSETWMRSGGIDPDGLWRPIKVDKEGRVIVSPISHTNERADSSVWIPGVSCTSGVPPGCTSATDDDGYVFKEDPCVEALRGAMEAMEPFIPGEPRGTNPLWETIEFYSWDGLRQLAEAKQQWAEAKLQCWRH